MKQLSWCHHWNSEVHSDGELCLPFVCLVNLFLIFSKMYISCLFFVDPSFSPSDNCPLSCPSISPDLHDFI